MIIWTMYTHCQINFVGNIAMYSNDGEATMILTHGLAKRINTVKNNYFSSS